MANDLQSSLVELAEAEARKAELTHWLTRDLKARTTTQRLPVTTSAPPPAAAGTFEPAALSLEEASWEEAPANSSPPDTLAPQVLAPELEEDDFAVLPRKANLKGVGALLGGLRRGAWLQGAERGHQLRRLAAAALVLLLVCLLFVKLRPGKLALVEAADAAAQPNTVMALLPPPPEEDAVLEEGEFEVEPVNATPARPRGLRRPKAMSETEAAEDDEGPRGPNVKRYPDLPNRVLTRLEQARKDGTSKRSDALEEEPPPSWRLQSDR